MRAKELLSILKTTFASWNRHEAPRLGASLAFYTILGLYLGKSSVGSTYGAAGSVIVVIVWVYYSAQIFFFGAEFTHAYAEHRLPITQGASDSITHNTAA